VAIEDLPSRRDDLDPRPPSPVGRDIDRVLAGFGAPPVPVLTLLLEQWSTIVGPAGAAHSHPTSLVDGRLRIEVDDPAWASQLTWQEHDLIERISQEVPGADIRGLQVRVRFGT
jgi:hypothetical protein